MRKTVNSGVFSVQAIAGTYVVMFGFNLPEESCADLAGFSIHRVDHSENESYYLKGVKAFRETDPGLQSGSLYSTKYHPVQSFQWADYSAKPGYRYTYTISALKGDPHNLVTFREVVIDITTESPSSGNHDIYFNRGMAASQEYARRFGNKEPGEVVNRKAWTWLSRGLAEALEDYVRSSVPGRDSLRIAAYEFNYKAFLKIVKETLDRGVDIEIVYDARKENPRIPNIEAINEMGLAAVSHRRSVPKSYISHNKFIVKLENGVARSVWTGGTNFSEGGIYGHSNVAHLVEEETIAGKYLEYWDELKKDNSSSVVKKEVEKISPLPAGTTAHPLELPPVGTSVLFSPRKDISALDWYSWLATNAREGLFMTFAFGINDIFKKVYREGKAPFRLALLEKKTRSMKAGPARDMEEKKIDDLRRMPENTFAIGDFVRTNSIDGWVKERLTSLNCHVRYIHNKFMLIDPLGDDPVIVSGSANFSEASTTKNDENMVVVRGNKRVADIYLGEFMRLYSHHAFRESLKWIKPGDAPKALKTGDWWKDYFGNTPRSTRREFFAAK